MTSSIGDLYIIANDTYLLSLIMEVSWDREKKKFDNLLYKENTITSLTKKELEEYFSRKREKFDLPLNFKGTPFQEAAWRALLDIPYGMTISYEKQAKNIANPKAIRAIGGANGANPIPIIIPCHRVIRKSGDLGGYASGLEIKKFLLNLENPKQGYL